MPFSFVPPDDETLADSGENVHHNFRNVRQGHWSDRMASGRVVQMAKNGELHEAVRNGILMFEEALLKNPRRTLDKDAIRKAAIAVWKKYAKVIQRVGDGDENLGPLEIPKYGDSVQSLGKVECRENGVVILQGGGRTIPAENLVFVKSGVWKLINAKSSDESKRAGRKAGRFYGNIEASTNNDYNAR